MKGGKEEAAREFREELKTADGVSVARSHEHVEAMQLNCDAEGPRNKIPEQEYLERVHVCGFCDLERGQRLSHET